MFNSSNDSIRTTDPNFLIHRFENIYTLPLTTYFVSLSCLFKYTTHTSRNSHSLDRNNNISSILSHWNVYELIHMHASTYYVRVIPAHNTQHTFSRQKKYLSSSSNSSQHTYETYVTCFCVHYICRRWKISAAWIKKCRNVFGFGIGNTTLPKYQYYTDY